jgi:hypothetical protein
MSIETAVHEALNKVTNSKSIFRPVGDGILDGHARIEDVISEVIKEENPRIEVHEFRSRLDRRQRLDVSNKGNLYDWLRENAGSSTLPGLYRRDGVLVRVPRMGEKGWIEPKHGEEDGPAQVRAINASALVDVVQHRFWPYVEKVDKDVDKATGKCVKQSHYRTHALVPGETCRLAIDGASEWDRVPNIASITHTPTLRSDGTLINTPGYDARSGVLFLPDNGLIPLEIPGEVPAEWVSWARDSILYLLRDFPFERPGHRSNMIAMLLTPILRRVIPPPYPMFLLNAHQRGTGKSLLARVARTLHGGVHRPELSPDDEEIRKQITSILSTTTAPYVNFDNVTSVIKSSHIANVLTTPVWSDRPLGQTGNIECTNDRVWLVTGNNIRIGGDMARRVQWISLDAMVPKPEYRTGFAEKNLIGYVTQNRGAILSALLVLTLWWVQRGMPFKEIRSDDYDRWAGGIAEILEGAGIGEGFGEIIDTGDPDMSDDELELGQALTMLAEIFGGVPWTVRDLRKRSETLGPDAELINDAIPGSCRIAKDIWKSFGRYMIRHERSYAGDLRAVKVGDSRYGVVWQMEKSGT